MDIQTVWMKVVGMRTPDVLSSSAKLKESGVMTIYIEKEISLRKWSNTSLRENNYSFPHVSFTKEPVKRREIKEKYI